MVHNEREELCKELLTRCMFGLMLSNSDIDVTVIENEDSTFIDISTISKKHGRSFKDVSYENLLETIFIHLGNCASENLKPLKRTPRKWLEWEGLRGGIISIKN